jgi:L-lactate dehydrogenase complex protein LldF
MKGPVLKPITDQTRSQALAAFTRRLREMRADGFGDPELNQAFRQRARAAKTAYLARPDYYLGMLADNLEKAGCQVHFAADADEARRAVRGILERAGAQRVVKSKSITCEEIDLNPHLEKGGITITETDLGEFIIQLAGERPFHILGPAMHRTRGEIAQLFADKLGEKVSDDPAELTAAARRYLRQRFLAAQAGISGVNVAAAREGALALITNEGNGRMATTLPRLHVAVMGLEKGVPCLDDLALICALLPLAATGAPMSTYISWLFGPVAPARGRGPREMHLVVVDNGRSRILDSGYWEILMCLRCSSCLNHCPVYGLAGGHVYAGAYSGPMGSVLNSLLGPGQPDDHLAQASTLCGRCKQMCPMGIDLPALLTKLRQHEDPLPKSLLPKLAAAILGNRSTFEAACGLARPVLASMNHLEEEHLPHGPWRAWRHGRRLPQAPGRTLLRRLTDEKEAGNE